MVAVLVANARNTAYIGCMDERIPIATDHPLEGERQSIEIEAVRTDISTNTTTYAITVPARYRMTQAELQDAMNECARRMTEWAQGVAK